MNQVQVGGPKGECMPQTERAQRTLGFSFLISSSVSVTTQWPSSSDRLGRERRDPDSVEEAQVVTGIL